MGKLIQLPQKSENAKIVYLQSVIRNNVVQLAQLRSEIQSLQKKFHEYQRSKLHLVKSDKDSK